MVHNGGTQLKPIGKAPSYLVIRSHSYCFRVRVPLDLIGRVGKFEIRCSLRTGSLKVAKQRAGMLAGMTRNLYKLIKRNVKSTLKDIDEILKLYKSWCVDGTIYAGFEGEELESVNRALDGFNKSPDIVNRYGEIYTRRERLRLDLVSGSSPEIEDSFQCRFLKD